MKSKSIENLLPISPIQQQSQSDYIVKSIMSMIEQGTLKEGDVLPPERELASQFKVSRNLMREAIKVLEVYGVVNRAPRLGTVIRQANIDHIIAMAFSSMRITPDVFQHIQEFRNLIEIGVAEEAIKNITDEILDSLEEKVSRMEKTTDLREQALWDYEFHYELVSLAGNSFVSRIYKVISEPMRRIMEAGKDRMLGRSVAAVQHREIIKTLRNKDLQAYKMVMSKHLEFGHQFITEIED